MSLAHALLTALTEHQPATGFELARRFDRPMGYYRHATHQQIYQELGQLERRGWVSTHRDPEDFRCKYYRILPAGHEELLRWVHTPTEPAPLRESLMVKLRADSLLGPFALQDEIQQRIGQHRQRLEQYRLIEQRFFAQTPPATHQQRMQQLILHTGMAYEQHSLEIFAQLLEALQQAQDPPAPSDRAE